MPDPLAAATRLLQQPGRVIDTEGGAEEGRDHAGDGVRATAKIDGHLPPSAQASGGSGDGTVRVTVGNLHDLAMEAGGETVPVVAIHRLRHGQENNTLGAIDESAS